MTGGIGKWMGLAALALAACNSGKGDDGGTSVSGEASPGCAELSVSPFPVGLEWLPDAGALAVAATFEPAVVRTLDAGEETPRRAAGVPDLGIPDDSDGDGEPEGSFSIPAFPQLDDVIVTPPALAAAGLGLITASGYEEVIWFRPLEGRLASLEVAVDAGFAPGDYRRLPAPGTSALRTAVSTDACFRPAAPIDSRGDDYAEGIPEGFFCDPMVPGSFRSVFTSGATVAADRLFVSMSNLGGGANTADPQFLPGAVLVYDLDLGESPPRVEPSPDVPAVETEGYNPTQVTRLERGGREWVLVTVSGPIGIERDDPSTPEVEQGTLALGDGAIEVIDPQSLEHLGAIPLGLGAPGFERLAIHPSGRLAAVGSTLARELYVVDLGGLDEEPPDLADAAVFDADAPLEFPALAGGPSLSSCAPAVGGVAWNDAGDRLYATERCDGSLSRFEFALVEGADGRIAPESFRWIGTERLVAPLRAETLGEQRDPGRLRIRPGRPGVDYRGPDALFLTSQPDGQACALRLQSF